MRAAEQLLSGWGRTAPSRARVLRPQSVAQLSDALAGATRRAGGTIARGAGRSYGDAAQNAGGSVIDTTALRGVLALDAPRGLVRVHAGTRLGELLRYLIAHDLTLAVVPGTRHVTVGGAIAADVHGKNHPGEGSFAAHVESFALCTPAGEWHEVVAKQEGELFRATAGGMGLTGVIVEATLRVRRLRSPWALADIDRVPELEQALALMSDGGGSAIAWVDLLAPGRAFGRAVLTRSTEAARVDRPARRQLSDRPSLSIPTGLPGRAPLRPAAVRAFNELHWRLTARRPRGRVLDIQANLFPLDVVGAWNRLYGRDGLVQYQFVVPRGQEPLLRRAAEHLRARGLPMYLATIKRLGAASGGWLSFPLEGWTLAIDLPAGAPGLRRALDELDELVAQAGGRVYLAKDSRMRAEVFAAMYPELERLRELRARVDPRGVLRSDLAVRLGV